ncbi:hypothetical protein RF11_03774 [Thelohanellus kitauei]|uniref:Uncharacterized protein n=1 Tax=Thelohanellus kitauei TaxID=669202 RepID=A0A0C2N4N5_THEKT|nr:hypothetical protein RF11_03774 [Thelohanellus kitauei]
MDECSSLYDSVFDFVVTYRLTPRDEEFSEVSVGKPAFAPAGNSKFSTGDPLWLRYIVSNIFDVIAAGKIYRRHLHSLKKKFGNRRNPETSFDGTYSWLQIENSEVIQNSKDSDVAMHDVQ